MRCVLCTARTVNLSNAEKSEVSRCSIVRVSVEHAATFFSPDHNVTGHRLVSHMFTKTLYDIAHWHLIFRGISHLVSKCREIGQYLQDARSRWDRDFAQRSRCASEISMVEKLVHHRVTMHVSFALFRPSLGLTAFFPPAPST